jgi:hypothetical protein
MDTLNDDWELSAARAAAVARQIQVSGRIQPWFLGVAGRAGQNPLVKVLLFTELGDPQKEAIKARLIATGVSYSLKDITLDPQARHEFADRGLSRTPSMVVLRDSGADAVIDGNDQLSLLRVIREFPRNERVEVLVEYTKQGSDRGEPHTH